MTRRRSYLLGLALVVDALAPGLAAQAEPLLETTVGMRARIEELPLPGSPLRAKPVVDPQRADMILRVLNVFPHGENAWRYNIEVMPFVAGRLDLRAQLERADGSTIEDLPELPIVVEAVLPAGQIEPNPLDAETVDLVGGYRTLVVVLGVLWVVGLLLILFAGRRRSRAVLDAEAGRPRTLADRLRPLVEHARDGHLDESGRAELERLLLAYWRRRLGLHEVKVGEAIRRLREDEEAGVLLRQLEEWLHRPADSGRDQVDVGRLLEPYRNAPDLEVAAEKQEVPA